MSPYHDTEPPKLGIPKMDDLVEALKEIAWVHDLIPSSGQWRKEPHWNIRLRTRPLVSEGTDAEVRRGYYLRAEEAIAIVERRDWTHSRAPTIEMGGTLLLGDPGKPPILVHECEVRMEGWMV